MTDNIVPSGVYTILYSRDRSDVVTVIGTRKIGRGFSVLFEGGSHMKLKDFQRVAIQHVAAPIEPTNGIDEAP